MPFSPVIIPEVLISRPLAAPLRIRTRFGQKVALGDVEGEVPCRGYEEIDSGLGYRQPRLHEAVDFEATEGDCVFAAYEGTVVGRSDRRGFGLTIDHHESAMGLVSSYVHLGETGRVALGTEVDKGQIIAEVGPFHTGAHLHFDLRVVIDRPGEDAIERDDDTSRDKYWKARNTLAVDPTRLLYRWEDRHTFPSATRDLTGVTISRVASVRMGGYPFFRFVAGQEEIVVPMYEPMTEQERLLISLVRGAYDGGRSVDLRIRSSDFFGVGNQNVLIGLVSP